MNKLDENIVVVSRAHLFGLQDEIAFQGAISDPQILHTIMNRLSSGFRPMRRGDAEHDPRFKQPIPYTVLVRSQDEGSLDVFAYERLSGGGEARLHGRLSIGVGGHINADAVLVDLEEVIVREAEREIMEEVRILLTDFTDRPRPEIIGLINDDSDEVGKVHIGILLMMSLPRDVEVEVRETDQLKGRWISLASASDSAIFDQLENWSRFALQAIRSRVTVNVQW